MESEISATFINSVINLQNLKVFADYLKSHLQQLPVPQKQLIMGGFTLYLYFPQFINYIEKYPIIETHDVDYKIIMLSSNSENIMNLYDIISMDIVRQLWREGFVHTYSIMVNKFDDDISCRWELNTIDVVSSSTVISSCDITILNRNLTSTTDSYCVYKGIEIHQLPDVIDIPEIGFSIQEINSFVMPENPIIKELTEYNIIYLFQNLLQSVSAERYTSRISKAGSVMIRYILLMSYNRQYSDDKIIFLCNFIFGLNAQLSKMTISKRITHLNKFISVIHQHLSDMFIFNYDMIQDYGQMTEFIIKTLIHQFNNDPEGKSIVITPITSDEIAKLKSIHVPKYDEMNAILTELRQQERPLQSGGKQPLIVQQNVKTKSKNTIKTENLKPIFNDSKINFHIGFNLDEFDTHVTAIFAVLAKRYDLIEKILSSNC